MPVLIIICQDNRKLWFLNGLVCHLSSALSILWISWKGDFISFLRFQASPGFFDRRALKCNSKDGCLEFCNNITVIGSYAILVDFPDLIREYLGRCAGAALWRNGILQAIDHISWANLQKMFQIILSSAIYNFSSDFSPCLPPFIRHGTARIIINFSMRQKMRQAFHSIFPS